MQTFAGIMAHHYDTPVGFNFDMWSKDPPIQVSQESQTMRTSISTELDFLIELSSMTIDVEKLSPLFLEHNVRPGSTDGPLLTPCPLSAGRPPPVRC